MDRLYFLKTSLKITTTSSHKTLEGGEPYLPNNWRKN